MVGCPGEGNTHFKRKSVWDNMPNDGGLFTRNKKWTKSVFHCLGRPTISRKHIVPSIKTAICKNSFTGTTCDNRNGRLARKTKALSWGNKLLV